MATINAVIVPAKSLKGGRHKVRISVAHNGETRYIVTNIVIDSAKEFKGGQIVRRADAAILNTKLRELLSRTQQAIDTVSYASALSCAELVEQIKHADEDTHRTLDSIYREYVENANIAASTANSYRIVWNRISCYINPQMIVDRLNHSMVLGLDKYLRSRHLSPTTIRNYMVMFMTFINYAQRCGYVQFRVNPFFGYTLPHTQVRDSWLSVDEVRRIRDIESDDTNVRFCRDIFMLSYYLGGINVVDLLKINFNEQTHTIHYERQKTENRAKLNKYVEFDIPSEAKTLIARLKSNDGYIRSPHGTVKQRLHYLFTVTMPELARLAGIKQVIYYSARKSFSQHAFKLNIQTCVIDYILGHRVDKVDTSLFAYLTVTPEMATAAVRQVLDNLK